MITGADWPTYLHDARRTANQGETILNPGNAGRLVKLWSFPTQGAIAASASVVSGTLYVGSWDGYEYALDAATGALKWKTILGQTPATHCIPPLGHVGITSAATVQGGVVYLGGGGPYWYALDAATGKTLWRVYTGDNSLSGGHYNWSSPLLYNGYAYVGIASVCDLPLVQGQLVQIDLRSHQIVHTLNTVPLGQVGGGIWTTPSVDAATNTLYVSTGTQGQSPASSQPLSLAIVALDASTLAVKDSWQIPAAQQALDSDWGVTPILFGDASGRPMVASINKNGYIYAFDRRALSAGPLWERKIASGGPFPYFGGGSVASGAFGNGVLYMAAGKTVITTTSGLSATTYLGAVWAFDPATGAILWAHGTPGLILDALCYSNGLVIDGGGKALEVLDARSGAVLYSYTTGGLMGGAPVISNGRIYAGSADGNEYAFGLPTQDGDKP